MNKTIFTIIILAIAGWMAIYGFKGQFGGSEQWQENINWTDPSITAGELQDRGKPVFVFVSTDWCHFCKQMKSGTFTDENVQKLLNEKFVNIYIDPEKQGNTTFAGRSLSYRQLAGNLGVSGYPTSVFLTSEAKILGSRAGYLSANDFIKTLESVSQN